MIPMMAVKAGFPEVAISGKIFPKMIITAQLIMLKSNMMERGNFLLFLIFFSNGNRMQKNERLKNKNM